MKSIKLAIKIIISIGIAEYSQANPTSWAVNNPHTKGRSPNRAEALMLSKRFYPIRYL